MLLVLLFLGGGGGGYIKWTTKNMKRVFLRLFERNLILITVNTHALQKEYLSINSLRRS